jgi:hypothetical protein
LTLVTLGSAIPCCFAKARSMNDLEAPVSNNACRVHLALPQGAQTGVHLQQGLANRP